MSEKKISARGRWQHSYFGINKICGLFTASVTLTDFVLKGYFYKFWRLQLNKGGWTRAEKFWLAPGNVMGTGAHKRSGTKLQWLLQRPGRPC